MLFAAQAGGIGVQFVGDRAAALDYRHDLVERVGVVERFRKSRCREQRFGPTAVMTWPSMSTPPPSGCGATIPSGAGTAGNGRRSERRPAGCGCAATTVSFFPARPPACPAGVACTAGTRPYREHAPFISVVGVPVMETSGPMQAVGYRRAAGRCPLCSRSLGHRADHRPGPARLATSVARRRPALSARPRGHAGRSGWRRR